MSRDLKRFREILKDGEHRLTAPRLKVVQKIFSVHEHFNADDLLSWLKKDGVPASRATVYRTLDLLLKKNMIKESDFGRGEKYYEHAFGHRRHYHLICLGCGKVKELRDVSLEKMAKRVEDSNKFTIASRSLDLYGFCKRCNSKKEKHR